MDIDEDRLSRLESRIESLERFINPTKFRRVEITPTFPIHDVEFPEEILILVLAYLSKKECLTCKLVCKRWDSIRHNVSIMRKSFAPPRSIQYSRSRPGAAPWQWSGWQKFIPNHLWMRVSCWIKFIDRVPPPSSNFGLKLHGRVDNSWVSKCRPDTWHHISSVARATGGDDNYILLIFDSIHEQMTARFTRFKLEILEGPKDKTPREECFAFTNSDVSAEFVVMRIGRKGIPSRNGNGSMEFVTDYPKEGL